LQRALQRRRDAGSAHRAGQVTRDHDIKNQEKMEFSFPETSPDCLSAIRIAPADAQMLKAAEAFN
ncbi:hypothetical protein QYY86_19890, partial [Xanthomonas campestris pv. campestris]|nr:hypothetical protein [Xanthomonas campestris pv. campestris]